jgi:hypothetical protein
VIPERLRIVFLVDAVFSAAAGLMFLSGTWDGFFEALDLPQGKPAIWTQLGGAVLVGVAYLLWLAARTPTLMLPLARASAVMNGLSVAIVVAWLINSGLGIETAGKIELAAAAVVMAAFTVAYALAGFRRGGYGPEPPPAPDRPGDA